MEESKLLKTINEMWENSVDPLETFIEVEESIEYHLRNDYQTIYGGNN